MSFLKKSLEKRIHELRHSIEAQTTELAAYEQVLALETGNPVTLAAAPAAVAAVVKKHTAAQHASKKAVVKKAAKPAVTTTAPITGEFSGSRSDFVAAVLKQHGAAGVTPSEISAAFTARKIAIKKNLVYNVLSLMFKQKKVRKSGGKYFLLATNGKAPAPAKAASPASPKKTSRISEEGMRRIIAATKKRWAQARAAKKSR